MLIAKPKKHQMNDFSYKKLIVWQKAITLLKLTYDIVAKLPKHEEYNLRSQLRRAALSVSSNIAEGSARKSIAERKRFYEMARSSAIEVDSQLEASIVLAYITTQDCIEVNAVLMEEFKLLTKMIEG